MKNKAPLISMGMPIYNEAKWLGQALDSLLTQTFEDFELIISDNASTDESRKIVQDYAAKDARIKLYHQAEDIGAIENFEFVLAQARGDYFMWVGGHDLWSSNLLDVLLKEMQANPHVVLCFPQTVLIDRENRPLTVFNETVDTRSEQSAAGRIWAMHRQLKRSNAIYGLHRREVLLSTLPWPKIVGGDSVLLVRAAAVGDVLTNSTGQWFRRKNHEHSSLETVQRRVQALKLSNLEAVFPVFATRVAIMAEFLKAGGSYREKIRLLNYGLRRLFLTSNQRQLFINELSFVRARLAQSFGKTKS
ncbi:MAG: glycosyltransferase family 2 protein [Anaerolineales bacterium]|nr:glycosyltransferase family 2 protein [Anaerolineales bacterium]